MYSKNYIAPHLAVCLMSSDSLSTPPLRILNLNLYQGPVQGEMMMRITRPWEKFIVRRARVRRQDRRTSIIGTITMGWRVGEEFSPHERTESPWFWFWFGFSSSSAGASSQWRNLWIRIRIGNFPPYTYMCIHAILMIMIMRVWETSSRSRR
jgi:hypothetical protein